ncbi:MAG: YihY/virulence factor BrkB family protein [Candidatus Sulfobium sp.]|jgi:membrane protein
MIDVQAKIDDFFIRRAWEADTASRKKPEVLLIKALRLLSILYWGLLDEQINLRAMGLVYTTLLSLVPFLAVSFSVLKALGAQTHLELLLYDFLAPLGPRGVDLSMKIIGFVENIKVGVLGAVGLAFLIYTVISNINKIESALNFIWGVMNPRGIAQRFSSYLSVILVGPVLVFSALGLTASLMNYGIVQKLIAMEPFGTVAYLLGKVIPYFFVWAAFTFVYVFLPNTDVKIKSASAGGLAAAILWETAGWVFASFIATSTKYSFIYSGFAIVILFMIWLYLSWEILLIGARISFYEQYPQFLAASGKACLMGDRLRERLVVYIMFLIGYNFYHNRAHWQFDSLVNRLGYPVGIVRETIAVLEKKGLLVRASGEFAYLPGRSLDTISVRDILDVVRSPGEKVPVCAETGFFSVPEIDKVMTKVDEAIEDTLRKETLKTLILSVKTGLDS